jgi:hypothetical protein
LRIVPEARVFGQRVQFIEAFRAASQSKMPPQQGECLLNVVY